MITSTSKQPRTAPLGPQEAGHGGPQDRPAASAAMHISRANLVLGVTGLVFAILVMLRLLEAWRVSTRAGSHQISLFGQPLSYPAANADAIVILFLAALGAIVTARAVTSAAHEVRASARLVRLLNTAATEARDDAIVISDAHPRAFCAGLVRPRVYVSTGAASLLDEAALTAVLAHERHHYRRRDPLRLAAGRVLAHALFFVPRLGELFERQQAMAELSADETAVHAGPGNRSALARAMLSFADGATPGNAAGVDPARVDYLLGEAPSWRFPVGLCLAAAFVLALMITVAVFVAQAAHGSATLSPPFLSARPCIVVLAAAPIVLGVAAANYRRRMAVEITGRAMTRRRLLG